MGYATGETGSSPESQRTSAPANLHQIASNGKLRARSLISALNNNPTAKPITTSGPQDGHRTPDNHLSNNSQAPTSSCAIFFDLSAAAVAIGSSVGNLEAIGNRLSRYLKAQAGAEPHSDLTTNSSPDESDIKVLLEQKSWIDEERSALFMTEAAQECANTIRKRTKSHSEVPGVVVCYSLGYVDELKASFGGHINVFRLVRVSDPNRTPDRTGVQKLPDDLQLQVDFDPTESTPQAAKLSQISFPGALRLSQPAVAPPDDPSHLINPRNPHFTATWGDSELVMVGSFHLNFIDWPHHPASRIRRRNADLDLSNLSPSNVKLLGSNANKFQETFFDLTPLLYKRSRYVGKEAWGLFRQQSSTVSPEMGAFESSSDKACQSVSLSENLSSIRLEPRQLQKQTAPSRSQQKIALDSNVTTTFQLPGRTLEVLPIGLGIVVGVSVLTVIFVGIVTWERKRYRQQFRERKKKERITAASELDSKGQPSI